MAEAITAAADEVVGGKHDEHFPLPVWQTGSGTQSNMNANEVIANRAAELLGRARGSRAVHPNDHVNRGQSSNDVIRRPSTLHWLEIVRRLLPALDALRGTLAGKAAQFSTSSRSRTHLQDATPLTLGQEFSGYVAQLDFTREAVSGVRALYPLAIGGTAVGTGLATHPQFGARVAADLAASTSLPFTVAPNRFGAGGARRRCSRMAAAKLAAALADCRRRALARERPALGTRRNFDSGKRTGSSIMPGKINRRRASRC
jgi:fumarate hydratase class II